MDKVGDITSGSGAFDQPNATPASRVNSVRALSSPASSWQVTSIRRIEDLQDAVEGAGLTPVQMARQRVTGTLAFAHRDGIVFSSGLLNGKVALKGPLSQELLTLGVGLRLDGRCQHWLNDVESGIVGAFAAGDSHDAIYSGRSLYVTVTLPKDRLLIEAEHYGVLIDTPSMQTGLCAQPLSAAPLRLLTEGLFGVHQQTSPDLLGGWLERAVLNAFLDYFGRRPRVSTGLTPLRGYERIVGRARDWIFAHLEEPLQVDQIAAAALTSRRTLHRAFLAVLEESPQAYVRRLRLHRLRAQLASAAEINCTIAMAANQCGLSELGRVSARYRALFGELPSKTVQQAQARTPSNLAQTA